MYLTRQLSFAGVTFDIKDLPLSKDFIKMYNDSVKLVSGTCVLIKMVQKFIFTFHIFLLAMLSTCELFVKLLWTFLYEISILPW